MGFCGLEGGDAWGETRSGSIERSETERGRLRAQRGERCAQANRWECDRDGLQTEQKDGTGRIVLSKEADISSGEVGNTIVRFQKNANRKRRNFRASAMMHVL
jgi:hypothetical protein